MLILISLDPDHEPRLRNLAPALQLLPVLPPELHADLPLSLGNWEVQRAVVHSLAVVHFIPLEILDEEMRDHHFFVSYVVQTVAVVVGLSLRVGAALGLGWRTLALEGLVGMEGKRRE